MRKQALVALVVVLTAGLAAFSTQAQGPGFPQDIGPGEGGATLKQPWLDSGAPAPRPAPPRTQPPPMPRPSVAGKKPVPDFLQGLLQEAGINEPAETTDEARRDYSLLPLQSDLNKDIEVTPELGPWLIFVATYSGKEAPQMAREMVMELRNVYKLPAYVFNYGAEEKRKELERVKAIIDKQRAFLRQQNLPTDQPIRVRHLRIDEHSGVLIGGYRDDESARQALDKIRELPPPDPTRVKLEQKLFYTPDPKDPGKAQGGEGEIVYANPFHRAFVVRNPAIKVERPAEWDQPDVEELRRLNSAESLSLLKCKKAFTLVVKQFSVPTVVQPANEAPAFLESIGLGKSGARRDAAAESAHNLAEVLRKARLEAYVLHTKFSSLVTIGSFDSLDDPNLRAMQHLIETQLQPTAQAADFFPRPMPMPIPR